MWWQQGQHMQRLMLLRGLFGAGGPGGFGFGR